MQKIKTSPYFKKKPIDKLPMGPDILIQFLYYIEATLAAVLRSRAIPSTSPSVAVANSSP